MAFFISTTNVISDDPLGRDYPTVQGSTHNNLHPLLDFPTDLRIDFATPVQWKQLTNGQTYTAGSLGVGYDYGIVATAPDGLTVNVDGQTTIYLLDRNGATINAGAFAAIDWANGAEPNFNSYNYWQIVITHRESGYSAGVFRWHASAVGFTN